MQIAKKKNQYQFSVVITQDSDGMFFAQVPSLHGCHTQAKTLKTLYKRIEEAIELCMEIQMMKKQPVIEEKFIGVQQIEITI